MSTPEGDLEITLNLWYIYDDNGLIYGLLVRPYVDRGPDEEKLGRLHSLAESDFWVARFFDLPKRFCTAVHTSDPATGQSATDSVPVFPLSVYNELEPLGLFEDAIKELEADLPHICRLKVPANPVVCVTPLFMDDSGNLTPKFKGQKRLSVDES